MKEKDLNTEQRILEAAEKMFIEKGFAATKTTEIAKEAGINHAMLHYYFRTKENLFDIVFHNKVKLLVSSFLAVVDQEIPFQEVIGLAVENHFEFLKNNPKLALFIINEINGSEKNGMIWQDIATPVFSKVVERIEQIIDKEAAKGNIRYIEAIDFVLMFVSLNAFPFIAQPFLKHLINASDEALTQFLERRKKENIRLILLALNPDSQ